MYLFQTLLTLFRVIHQHYTYLFFAFKLHLLKHISIPKKFFFPIFFDFSEASITETTVSMAGAGVLSLFLFCFFSSRGIDVHGVFVVVRVLSAVCESENGVGFLWKGLSSKNREATMVAMVYSILVSPLRSAPYASNPCAYWPPMSSLSASSSTTTSSSAPPPLTTLASFASLLVPITRSLCSVASTMTKSRSSSPRRSSSAPIRTTSCSLTTRWTLPFPSQCLIYLFIILIDYNDF